MSVDKYIPHKGDIIWIDFDPSAGKEIQKRRPGLVVSSYAFNKSTYFAVVCPITSTLKNYSTRFNLTSTSKIKGQVLISQLKSLDYMERNSEFVEKISTNELEQINQLVSFVFAE
ncbi:type II toxin-antitoxin system PemK/MazF family toxin [Marinilactibacillus psychrotolerans]|uniref:Toxin-antitoxin addiction module toxin component MazF n=2 Tax=Marinilactibacillus TaxID=191769 RepID=A0A511H0R7_9LACT|nr:MULTISPECIES: type II toxin-antitoxin system PemK/MazF family toxin [Marinilactibacillus]API89784.1 PemK family transcriptional regulator [Marinilactibacillus sp. 15R]TLQ07787.1 type II toxin-antitoxin system PemK/MazF family toxin [Marinilactibacillus psychrotolerans]SDC87754.1 mRNA interferase MazF [Marinilactibacillus psychrotolerans]SFK10737.1 mRNA interferase MazF [Marinilactibacillus piezotolerans]GEL67122.1 mRNA interferase PemK [Marinilactibacillus psychrotolerans]